MSTFTVRPLSPEIADHVRNTGTDPIYGYDYDVRRSLAGPDGYGPCRQCLKTFEEGDERLLFLYNPFTSALGDFAGPVFICADPCVPYDDPGGFPPTLRPLPLLLRAYDGEGQCTAQEEPLEETIERSLEELLDRPDVAFVHIRNTEARCFIAHVDGGGSGVGADRDGMRKP